ncbi:MAG: energy transducer TonB, partial [Gammaproteobacteria bacterium]
MFDRITRTMLVGGCLMWVAIGMQARAVYAESPGSLDELLEFVKHGNISENKENKAREKRFIESKKNQKRILMNERRARKNEESLSLKLEDEHRKNDVEIKELTEKLRLRMGNLKELFGVIQQVAGDTRGLFEGSIISAEFPGREKFLNEFIEKMTSDSELASINDMEKLWFELQREMTESGKVSRFDSSVIFANGHEETQQVIRVGSFNLIGDGQYLSFSPETGKIVVLPRQPRSEFVRAAQAFSSSTGHTLFGLDPSRGQILKLLMQSPNLEERIRQGGTVGYAILCLGAIAF